MCRLLCVRSATAFRLSEHLDPFAVVARDSREYQGHGWGCAWLGPDGWRMHHDIRPIWEDPSRPDEETTLLLAHARSAFRDEGIVVENNMPFSDGERVFIFNGELNGVRIKAAGRIGAEKIFNYVKRFDRGDLAAAVERGVEIIEKRTRRIRAMNFLIGTPDEVIVCSHFSQEPEYFQMRRAEDEERLIICSEPYGNYPWKPIENRRVERH